MAQEHHHSGGLMLYQKVAIIYHPNNPSAPDLLDAFARAKDKPPKLVTLKTDAEKIDEIDMCVLGLRHEESDSPCTLVVHGFTTNSNGDRVRLEAYYDPGERMGFLKIGR